MIELAASAPGKAVISGEYAVLAGAPALSMALNRRAIVTIASSGAAHHTVIAPGYIDAELRFRVAADGAFDWLDALPAPGAFALLEAVWRRTGLAQSPSLAITLDTRGFVDAGSGLKLGIGSSAALAVAMAAAFGELSAAGDSPFLIARDAHSAFQNGKGSGVDVATSCHGGVIGFRRSGDYLGIKLPAGLDYRFFWSGTAAKTAQKIARVDAGHGDPALGAASERVVDLAQSGSAEEFLAELKHFVDSLTAYDDKRSLGIFAAGHRALVDLARPSSDLIYKPCGAGGGDIGIAMATSSSALRAFADHAATQGFVALDARLEESGVLVEAS